MADAQAVQTFFSGTYTHTLDTKGRVSLPAKFRKDLPVSLKLVPRDGVIYLFPVDDFNAWVMSFFPQTDGKPNPASKADRKTLFSLTSHAEDTEIDTAGRISISAGLRQMASLEKEVKVVGLFDHIEIMSPASYEALDDGSDEGEE